jgi:hypothetical protein
MVRKILFSAALAFLLNDLSAQVDVQWVTRWTSTGSNPDRVRNMVTDPAGNVYVTGSGFGAVSGNFDYITVKYNNAGVQQWVADYNGTGNALDEARAVAVDASGNVYVTGWSAGPASNYNIVTVKYDMNGNQQWVNIFDGTNAGNDEPWAMQLDNSGNIYVTGDTDSGGSGGENFVLIQINNAGVQQWVKTYTGPGNNIDIAYAIAVDPATGNSYITGASQGTGTGFDYATLKYNNAGIQQWVKRFNGPVSLDDIPHDLKIDAAGNVYVTGESAVSTTNLTDFQYSTLKYDNLGNQLWNSVKNGTATEHDVADALVVDGVGNVYVTGKMVNLNTAEDLTTIKYNALGAQQWMSTYDGSMNYDEGKDIAVDANGYIYITGYSYSAASNDDYVTMKMDSLGVRQWLTKYNGPGNNSDQAIKIALDAGANAYITGTSRGSGTNDDFATIKYCQLTAEAGPNVAICTGGSTTLNASALGAVSYSWDPPTGLSNIHIANPVATPTATITYSVAITNASGCVDVDSVTVTVHPLPGPVISSSGPTSFCIGGSVTLTSNPSSVYSWSTGATTQAILVSTSGTYTCQITDTNSCVAQSTATVTVNPLPIIEAGPNDTVCRTHNVCLTGTGAVQYAWSPNITISDTTIANPCVGPLNTITYILLGTDANGCKNRDSVTVTVIPNPAAPPIFHNFDTLLTHVTGVTYQWYYSPSGLPVPGATSSWFKPMADSSYYLEITTPQGCTAFSSTIAVNNVGIHEIYGVQNVLVYPNPANSMVNLELQMAEQNDLVVSIFSIAGQLISSEIIHAPVGTTLHQIDLSTVAKGMYMLQIRSGQGSYFSRLEVQ